MDSINPANESVFEKEMYFGKRLMAQARDERSNFMIGLQGQLGSLPVVLVQIVFDYAHDNDVTTRAARIALNHPDSLFSIMAINQRRQLLEECENNEEKENVISKLKNTTHLILPHMLKPPSVQGGRYIDIVKYKEVIRNYKKLDQKTRLDIFTAYQMAYHINNVLDYGKPMLLHLYLLPQSTDKKNVASPILKKFLKRIQTNKINPIFEEIFLEKIEIALERGPIDQDLVVELTEFLSSNYWEEYKIERRPKFSKANEIKRQALIEMLQEQI